MGNKLHNVLLVDDSSTNNLLLESAFKGLNFEITTAMSGEEALELMKKNNFRLVMLDVMMPGMSGYDVLTKMKEENITPMPSVIVVTARSKVEEEKMAFELGAVDYFEKPLDLPKLINTVKEIINK